MIKYVCSQCGGSNIHIQAWININTNEHVGDIQDATSNVWCADCQTNVQHEEKMKKQKKTHQSDAVSFHFIDEGDENIGWAITHPISEGVYYFSEKNTWNLDYLQRKKFGSLHAAVNYANKRGFCVLDVPNYEVRIDDLDTLIVSLNGLDIAEYKDIKSEKQVSDIMRKKYAVNLAKLEYLL